MQKVFLDIENNFIIYDWLYEQAILALKNDDVNKIICQIPLKLLEKVVEYKSIDKSIDEE